MTEDQAHNLLTGRQPAEAALRWFCVRAQPRHEHIAAGHLRQVPVEVFLPRIRFRRSRRQGPVWVTEALFPTYLFARFCWTTSLRLVHHSPGVAGVVRFGDRWPTVPDELMRELQAQFAGNELRVISDELTAGDAVEISGGAFHGLTAIVSRVVPARQRVAVLLEFLGRQTCAEVPLDSVVKQAGGRQSVL
jgi:transcriptional antiterminator RfaH